jgi:diguanylate cyclase (GGDEF)-like protein
MRSDTSLENKIDTLLADEQYTDHPLREVLGSLYAQYKNAQSKWKRLASISDGYQWMARERHLSLGKAHQKQARQLSRITKISDRYQAMLQEKNRVLKKASTHDQLTGLPNRRLILDRIAAAAALATQNGKAFSLAVIDVDDFKSINDQYGHSVGDRVLVHIAHALTNSIRSHDVCARWGGEEFILLLPGVPGSQAVLIAERLRREVEQLLFKELSSSVKSSISIGVAEHQLQDKGSETIARADHALYEAKRSGRNKVAVAE